MYACMKKVLLKKINLTKVIIKIFYFKEICINFYN